MLNIIFQNIYITLVFRLDDSSWERVWISNSMGLTEDQDEEETLNRDVRSGGNVVAECCWKKCHLSTLKQFCRRHG